MDLKNIWLIVFEGFQQNLQVLLYIITELGFFRGTHKWMDIIEEFN